MSDVVREAMLLTSGYSGAERFYVSEWGKGGTSSTNKYCTTEILIFLPELSFP